MRRLMHSLICVCVAAGLSLACSLSGATPMPVATLRPTSPRGQPATPVPTTVSQPGVYAPFPTATAYFTPEPQTGRYENGEYGLTVAYPDGWSVAEPEDGSLVWFVGPQRAAQASLWVGTFAPGEDLAEKGAAFHAEIYASLPDARVEADEAFTLSDGRAAWLTIVSAQMDNGELTLVLMSTTYGSRLYTFLVSCAAQNFTSLQADIGALLGAVHLEAPLVYGLLRSETLVLEGGESTNPRDYDPATGSGDGWVFSGLVRFQQQQVVPDLAAGWDISAAGTVYTFKLRTDARFHNGRPVVAQDVVYSWERAARPATNSNQVLTYLGDIVGVKEMQAGQADHIAGLKVIDAHTLQVTLDAPKPYFLYKLTYATANIVDQANVESGPEWYRTPNGTGPYRLIRWDRFQLKLYARNDDFYREPPKIKYVAVQLYTGNALQLYEMGAIDMTGVSNANVARFQDPKEPLQAELHSSVSLCTAYVVFDVAQPPFDDVKVRQAFTQAFNRQQYIDVVLNGLALPAVGLYPPALPGYTAALTGLAYDPQRARQLLAESKYHGPQGLPPIVFTSLGQGSYVGSDVAALAQMWEQNLGVTITVENLDPDEYYDQLHAGYHGQLFDGGWCADYPDAENFADVLLHSEAQQNLGHYGNAELDVLLEQARVERDGAARLALYQQAEQLIVADAPLLFTTHSLSFTLVKPYLQGYDSTPFSGAELWIDPTKLE